MADTAGPLGRIFAQAVADKRIGAKKARVAVARKLACLLVRLWGDESHYDAARPVAARGGNDDFDLTGSNRWDECGTAGCKASCV